MNTKEWIKQSNNAHNWVDEKKENGAEHRWLNKEIEEEVLIWDGKSLNDVKLNGVGVISYDVTTQSIRLDVNDDVENLVPRPNCSILVDTKNNDYSKYNRISLMIKPISTGFVNFYIHISFGNKNNKIVHAPSVIPHKWNHIVFELEDLPRDNVDSINITPFLFGTPPEALPDISFLIKDIKVQKINEDYVEGWNIDNRIAYSHVGYFINQQKIAIVDINTNNIFYIKDINDNVVYENIVKESKTSYGNFNIIDFTEFKEQGKYYIEVGSIKSNTFEISDNPYELSIWKSIQFLRTLRCGEEVEHVHSACHLNCRTVHSNGHSVPNFGGWHDAGDVSQFEICTAEMAEALLDLANSIKNKDYDLYIRLMEEAKIGINWILRTYFGDGERALAVLYNIWRKNELDPTNEGVRKSISEVGPFESFLASSCLLTACVSYKDIDTIFSDWCLRVAKLDFDTAVKCYQDGIHTKRWGSNIDSQVAGIGAVCSSKLYQITKDEKYKNLAIKYGDIIISCQQTEVPNWDKPIRGYFYEDPKHEKMLSYEHRGHEENPIRGLVKLCEVFYDNSNYSKWHESIKLYREYVLTTYKYTSPYGVLPAHIYELNKFNMERFTVPAGYGTIDEAHENLKEQARHGIKLNEDVYLRIFPVAIQRRGYHATLLSKTKAVSLIAKYLNDNELKQIVINQLEWIMGKNPFSTSTMYGEGYNYHPLYVAYSPQLIGSLPVGFKTKGFNDRPYWPVVNNAVFKEIWGHTTGKFLWIFEDLIK